jgi:putative ABC transport system permease protein
MGVAVGDTVELGGRPVRVVGVAVSAALPPYPQLCTVGCILDRPDWFSAQPGLVWATRARTARLATPSEPLSFFQFLTLHHPAAAPAFVSRHSAGGPPEGRPELVAWQDIAGRQAEQLTSERTVVVFGSTLLVILALATLVVLVGGRMGDEVRRVGILKAAGATPGFVTRLLLGSYVAVGLAAGMVGVVAGRFLAPVLVTRSAGLLGRTGATSVTLTDAMIVLLSLMLIVIVASAIPAWRAARTSTVRALADSGRGARRSRILVALSSKLPASALLGLRLFARRPRRALLTSLSVALAVCGSVVVLYAQTNLRVEHDSIGGPENPVNAQLHAVMTAMTVLLVVMASVNLLFVTRASAVDARQVIAIARTLGASPADAAIALGTAQIIPAVAGLLLGEVGGSLLFQGLSDGKRVTPDVAQLIGLGLLAVIVATLLTAVPARIEAHRPIATTIHHE